MKQNILRILIIALFIVGIGMVSYPTVSNEWNTYVQNRLIANYESSLKEFEPEDYTSEWNKAREFNSTITENSIGTDYFETGSSGNASSPTEQFFETEYYSVLNINGDGVMGYLSIPKINLKLPIMHGSFDNYLQKALGHMNGTALPIGSEGTHSVIVGHRGLPAAELFTNLDQMEIGDMFYIHVLDETLAYQVDNIEPMIEADDLEALSEAMAVEDGKDYVTLFTCTPYGVNTHRLLVRGIRVEYMGDDVTPTGTAAVVNTLRNYYLIIAFSAIIIALIIILIIRALLKRKQEN